MTLTFWIIQLLFSYYLVVGILCYYVVIVSELLGWPELSVQVSLLHVDAVSGKEPVDCTTQFIITLATDSGDLAVVATSLPVPLPRTLAVRTGVAPEVRAVLDISFHLISLLRSALVHVHDIWWLDTYAKSYLFGVCIGDVLAQLFTRHHGVTQSPIAKRTPQQEL